MLGPRLMLGSRLDGQIHESGAKIDVKSVVIQYVCVISVRYHVDGL